jgi:cyclic pyranopterin phosphate synthase
MCKAVDKGMTFGEVGLLKKTGGKSGTFIAPSRGEHARAAR